MMRFLVALCVLLLACFSIAARVVIDTGDDESSQLEVRTVELPSGEEHQVYIIRGQAVTVTIDDETIIRGTHLEFDFDARTVRVIGEGKVETRDETIDARDFLIYIDDEHFYADDVLIVTGQIDVTGDTASRVPGQIRVAMGEFSPCARCGQEVNDYGFRGERIDIYPGDRIVAYSAVVLIRDVPVMNVPLLVIPIGPPDRIPRLVWKTGTAEQRAEIGVTWPYVAGAEAYGNIGVRYYADVVPGTWLQDTFLGGEPEHEYVGGFIDHRFYTERGAGSALIDYTPGFVDEHGVTGDSAVKIDVNYSDSRAAEAPWWSGSVKRNDAQFPNIWELNLETEALVDPFQITVRHLFFVERAAGQSFTYPSYYRSSRPLNEYFHVQIEPIETRSVNIGPFRLERFLVTGGVYSDFSNPLNRRASLQRISEAGRVEQWITLSVPNTEPLWAGFRVSGRLDFRGQQYTTQERQVSSIANIGLTQEFGSYGNLSISWRRNVQEGETPFRFDAIAYRHLNDVQGTLRITPWRWFQIEERGGYLITDSRLGKENEWLPLRSRLSLFHNTNWLRITVENTHDFEEEDPGVIDSNLRLRTSGTFSAELNVQYVYDLKDPTFDMGYVVNDTVSRVNASASVRDIFAVEVETGYRYFPEPKQGGLPGNRYEDLIGRVTLGTLTHNDAIPGARVAAGYDLNEEELNRFGVELSLTAFTLELDASIEYRFPSQEISRSRLQVRWPAVALLRAEGLAWFPAEIVGIEPVQPTVRNFVYTLAHSPERGGSQWEVKYATQFDPNLAGYRNSLFTARVQIARYDAGPLTLSVDGFLELPIADDQLDSTYLRRASATFGLQAWDRVGIQGKVGYSGQYNAQQSEVVEGRLQLQQVSVVTRPFDDIYLGMVLDDIWDITGNSTEYPDFNFQPTFTIVWNRCCWAVYGSWNTATGAVAVTLTTPGATQGIGHVLETDWMISRREP